MNRLTYLSDFVNIMLRNPVIHHSITATVSKTFYLMAQHCVPLDKRKLASYFKRKSELILHHVVPLYSIFSFPQLGLRWNEERIEDISTSSYLHISIKFLTITSCLYCWNLLFSSYSINPGNWFLRVTNIQKVKNSSNLLYTFQLQ